MNKKYLIGIAALLSLSLCSTGCAQITDLSEEESDLIAAYAAESISKYNIYQKDGVAAVDLTQMADETQDTETVESTEAEEATEEEETGQDAESPSLDEAAGEIAYSSTETVGQALGLPDGVHVKYGGFELSDYYNSGSHFSLNAADGNTYVVVKFILQADADTAVDIASLNPTFTMSFEDVRAEQSHIYIDEDFSGYTGTLTAGEEKELFLFFEVSKDKAEAFSDYFLFVTVNGETVMLDYNN